MQFFTGIKYFKSIVIYYGPNVITCRSKTNIKSKYMVHCKMAFVSTCLYGSRNNKTKFVDFSYRLLKLHLKQVTFIAIE